MTTTQNLVFIHALTALHPGTGQGVGDIDLPIAREKATGIPYLPGSSLKGSLRATYEGKDADQIFGSENPANESSASAIQFTDMRLIALPVRSLAGTFAYVTSPYLLHRLRRDALDTGLTNVPAMPPPMITESTIVTGTSTLKLTVGNENKVLLEDLDLPIAATNADEWAKWLSEKIFPTTATQNDDHTFFTQRLCIVHDDIMTFLLDTALEINARIRIDDDKKTVAKGALWYEEMLPAETILAGLAVANPPRKTELSSGDIMAKVQNIVATHSLQLGGKATIGKGLCRVIFTGKE